MCVVKYILVSNTNSNEPFKLLGAVNTPAALGIIARDHPDAVPLIRQGYGEQFGSPHIYFPLVTAPYAYTEYLKAKEGKT